MRCRLTVPAVALALCLSACGSPAAAPPAGPAGSATASAASSPAATPGGTISLTDAVALGQARGLTERTTVPLERPGVTAGVLAVLADGTLVVVDVQQPTPTPDTEFNLTQSQLELVDPHGATVPIPNHRGAVPRVAEWAAGDPNTVVWLETPAQNEPGYAILAYDRKSRTTHLVATSEIFEPFVVQGVGFAGGRVYWSDPKSASTTAPAAIYSRDAGATGPIRRESIPDSNVAFSDGNVFWTATTPDGTVIHRRAPGSDVDQVITTVPDQKVRALAASGNDLAWTAGSHVTLRQADGTTTTVDCGDRVRPGGVVLTSDFLGFVTDSAEWALDRHDNQLVHLAEATDAQVLAAGSRLVWQDGSNWEVADFSRD